MNHRTRTAAIGVVAAAALLLVGCGSSDSGGSEGAKTTEAEATTTVAGEVQVKDAWARQSPMETTAGAVYLTITSPVDDELVGASVPTSVAATTEIHETVMAEGSDDSMGESTTTMAEGSDDSMGETTETTMAEGSESMTMRPVESIELPAGETVKLEPGGYHIMLLDLAAPLEAGQTIEVTLTFAEAGEQTVTAEVREA